MINFQMNKLSVTIQEADTVQALTNSIVENEVLMKSIRYDLYQYLFHKNLWDPETGWMNGEPDRIDLWIPFSVYPKRGTYQSPSTEDKPNYEEC